MNTFTKYVAVPAVSAALALGTTTRSLESRVQQHTLQVLEPEYGLPVLTMDAYERITGSGAWEGRQEQYLELLGKDKELVTLLEEYLSISIANRMEDGPRNVGLLLCYTLGEEAKRPTYKQHGNLPRLSKDVSGRIAKMKLGRLHMELRRLEGAMRRKDPLMHSILEDVSKASLTDETERSLPKGIQYLIIASEVTQQVYIALQEAAREAAPKATTRQK